ncbi:MAG: MBL fold metallo-hydrolase, partial [Haloarculaceae archaeon]
MAPDGQTAVYLVDRTSFDDAGVAAGTSGGIADDAGELLVVDPARATPSLVKAIDPAASIHLAVTHHHPDHVGGLADLAEQFDATVWARRGRAREFEAATGVVPDRTFLPGETLPILDGVAVVDTPGHAPEHVALGTEGWLLTGDLVVAEGSVVVGGKGADMRAYLTSLRRLHARNPDRLYPAHGPDIEDVRTTCARLIHHRLDRERRVHRAVGEGAETAADILDAAYDKELTGVRDLALATVEAHLRKLAAEGSVRWDGQRVSPTGGGP